MRRALLIALCGALITTAQATPDDDLVRPVQERWAEIKYRNPAKEQADQYHQLAQQARHAHLIGSGDLLRGAQASADQCLRGCKRLQGI